MNVATYHAYDSKAHSGHPAEDAFAVRNQAFGVADGITRDPVRLSDFSKHTQAELFADYPSPSPAAEAARAAADAFVATLDGEAAGDTAPDVMAAMRAANQAVAEVNRGRTVDYLAEDYAGCTLAGGVITDGELRWASIGDCFVAVFSADGRRRLLSPNGVAAWERYEAAHPGDWNTPAYRRQVRREFRNNPQQIVGDEVVSYGALTGEPAAGAFMHEGSLKLAVGDVVVAYSDGLAPLAERPDFFAQLQRGSEALAAWDRSMATADPKRYGKERTVVWLSLG